MLLVLPCITFSGFDSQVLLGLIKDSKSEYTMMGTLMDLLKSIKEIVDPFSGIPSLTASYKDSIIYVCSTIPESITGLNI